MTITEDRQKKIRDMTLLQIWHAIEPRLNVAMQAYQFGPSSYTYEALQACMDIRDILLAAIAGLPGENDANRADGSLKDDTDKRNYDRNRKARYRFRRAE
jgi:hypothetical protein